MSNKKNKKLIKNDYSQNNSHNKKFDLTDDRFELNDKEIENIKPKINFKEENDELDKNELLEIYQK